MVFNWLKRKRKRRVFIIGLDCGDPHLVFDQWRDELPTFRRLMQGGAYGILNSSIPCITVPAWTSMLSSRDPGVLGFYGFRNRADYTYDNMTIANGSVVRVKRVWDILGDAGKQVIVVGVPQTYPVRPVSGHLVSGFLTPNIRNEYTYPNALRHEIDQVLKGRGYDLDVPDFRTEDKEYLLRQIYDMTDKRFEVLKYLQTTKPWDFFMFVEMGVDRIQHAFWQFQDPRHVLYEPDNPYQHVIRDYYKYLDNQYAELLSNLDDDTIVLVVSDHGGKRMDGGICLNQWLHREGYLAFKEMPKPINGKPIPFENTEIDWERTTAWGAGGYYGRVFLNVRGREPQGMIGTTHYERVRAALAEEIAAIPDPDGKPIGTTVYRPEDVYRRVNNIPPDLIVYFGNLYWRSVGSLGHDTIHTSENDTGPDGANHAQEGMVIYHDPRQALGGRSIQADLMDIAPTVLKIMDVPVPEDMQGEALTL